VLLKFSLCRGDAALTGVKSGVESTAAPAKFHRHRCRGGLYGPKTENFDQISKYKLFKPAYPMHDFYDILKDSGELYAEPGIKIRKICPRHSRVTGFKYVRPVAPKFQRP